MTGRNPWVVLGVAEGTPYHEVHQAFRRRAKDTHPDNGGNAGEFDALVQAFDTLRPTLDTPCPRNPMRTSPYDPWLRPNQPVRSWTDGSHNLFAAVDGDGGAGVISTPLGNEFVHILHDEMARMAST